MWLFASSHIMVLQCVFFIWRKAKKLKNILNGREMYAVLIFICYDIDYWGSLIALIISMTILIGWIIAFQVKPDYFYNLAITYPYSGWQ